MVSYTQEVTLDINSNGPYQTISAKQGDSGRIILAKLTQDNEPYILSDGIRAFIRCRKPDGHGIINQATVNVGTNEVEVQLTAQTLAIAGRAYADLVLYDQQNTILSTISFIIVIMSAPSVAEEAISSSEFNYLQEVVDTANDVINEAESWARGTKVNVAQTSEYYKFDVTAELFDFAKNSLYIVTAYQQEIVTAENFQSKKNNLYILENDIYVPVSLSAEYDSQLTYYIPKTYEPVASDASYIEGQIYYALTAGDINNAKYYAEQAKEQKEKIEQLKVSSITLETGEDATVEKTIDSAGILTLNFGLPAGEKGDTGNTGPQSVYVGDTEPSGVNDFLVWLNPLNTTADLAPFTTANQITYDENKDATQGTVAAKLKTVDSFETSINSAMTNASDALNKASAAKTDVDNLKITKVNLPANSSDSSLDFGILTKNNEYIQVENLDEEKFNELKEKLYIKDNEDNYISAAESNYDSSLSYYEFSIITNWSPTIEYTALNSSAAPKINSKPIIANTNYTLAELGIAAAPSEGEQYYIKPSAGIPATDLTKTTQRTLERVDDGITRIVLNNATLPKVDNYDVAAVSSENFDDNKDILYIYDTTEGTYNLISPDATYNSNITYYNKIHNIVNLGSFTNRIVGKNYLDNPWLTINQHEDTEIVGGTAGTYIYDRWKILSTGTTDTDVTIKRKDQKIVITNVNDNFSIGQIIDDEIWKTLSGKYVCASISYSFSDGSSTENYTTKSWSFRCPIYNTNGSSHELRFDTRYCWGGQVQSQIINEKNILTFEIVFLNSWSEYVVTKVSSSDFESQKESLYILDDGIYTSLPSDATYDADTVYYKKKSVDSPITINKMKLELGDISTLDAEAPPIYSEELKKCQRYYCYYGGKSPSESQPIILGSGIAASSTQLDWIIPIENMISTPKLYSSVNLVAYKSFGTATGSSGTLTPSNLNNSTISTGIRGIPITTTSTSNMSAAYRYYVILPKSVAAEDSSQSDTISYFTLNAEP